MTTIEQVVSGAETAMNHAMRTSQPQVSVRVLYPFAAALREEGVDPDLVLDDAHIATAIYYEQDSRIPLTALRRFHYAAARRSRDPALGLAAARHFGLARFQILEYFAATSPHLGAALDALVKNERVLSDVNAIRLDRRTEGVLLRVEPPTAGWHRCYIEFAVGTIYLAGHRILAAPQEGARRTIPWFAYPASACAAEYEMFFGTGVRFDAPASGLLIPGPALKERLESADTWLHEALGASLNDLALRTTPCSSFLERARAILCKALPDGDSCVDALATSLHMSPSTLRRRLRQEGVTHRSLLQEVRRELALRYLEQQKASIDEIAYLVGYDDSTAFYRAFKKWTGSTPARHRTRMRLVVEDASPLPKTKRIYQ